MNQKFLPDGQAVNVIGQFGGGFVVCRIFEDQDTGEIINGKSETVGKVFDKAPLERMDKEFVALQANIDDLRRKQLEASKAFNEAKAALESQSKKLARVEQLRLLEDFIDGKITHYVELCGWDTLKVVKINDTVSEYGDGKMLRLLTLFGDSKGNLAWQLNRYRDGSGCDTEIFPVTSEAAAISLIKERILSDANDSIDNPKESVIKSAAKFGVDLPAGYSNLFYQNFIANHSEYIKKESSKLDEHVKLIENARAKITNPKETN